MKFRTLSSLLISSTLVSAGLLVTLPAFAQTTYSGGTGGSIPDSPAAGISSTINVGDSYNIVSFDNILISGLTHTWLGDLVVTLTHGATTVDILDRVGSSTSGGFGDSSNLGGNYTFSLSGTDFAALAAANGTNFVMPTGTYTTVPNSTAGSSSSANGSLTNFNGLNVNGAWTLTISDRAAGDTGVFTGWQFTTNPTPPPPPPPPPASSIDDNAHVSGTLAAGEIDWFTFNMVGGSITIDTLGSLLSPDNDTEIGLYDTFGALIATNDDIDVINNNLLSRLSFNGNLPVGQYYLAVGAFNTAFGASNFSVTSTSTNVGSYQLNLFAVPEPGTFMLAGLGLLPLAGIALRRRKA